MLRSREEPPCLLPFSSLLTGKQKRRHANHSQGKHKLQEGKVWPRLLLDRAPDCGGNHFDYRCDCDSQSTSLANGGKSSVSRGKPPHHLNPCGLLWGVIRQRVSAFSCVTGRGSRSGRDVHRIHLDRSDDSRCSQSKERISVCLYRTARKRTH